MAHTSGFYKRFHSFLVIFFMIMAFSSSAYAAAQISIDKRLGWNIVGLDSNDVTSGPNTFPIGYRFCNTGDANATNVVGTFEPDATGDAYIHLEPGTSDTISVDKLVPGECYDFYYNIEVTRNAAAYDHTLPYQIGVISDQTPTAVKSNAGEELYAEHLISQNRNSINAISGPSLVLKGRTYHFQLDGSTATNGYEQLATFLDFPNTIFRIISVSAVYSVPTALPTNDAIYADACGWVTDPASSDYFTSNGDACANPDLYPGGKVGGDIYIDYEVEIIGTGSKDISALIYDFSGSSFHYNSDYGVEVLSVQALDEEDLDLLIFKSASRTVMSVASGEVDTFTLLVRNPAAAQTNVSVTDTLPTGWGYVSGSTQITWNDGSVTSVDPTVSGQDLAWTLGNMDLNQTISITFDAVTIQDFTGGDISTNSAKVVSDTKTFESTVDIKFISIAIEKSSVPSQSPLIAGNTIDYTLNVRNTETDLTTRADLHNIIVKDDLPMGTSYVPGTSSVTAYVTTASGNYLDILNNIAYDGSDGSLNWSATPWVESESPQSATAGDIQVIDDLGNYVIKLADDGNILRRSDLSGYNRAFLNFSYKVSASKAGTQFKVEITPDGGAIQELLLTLGDTAGTHKVTYDISSYISSDTEIKFSFVQANGDGSSFVQIDDVEIQLANRVLQTNSAGTPPALLTAADGYDLWPNEDMNITFQVKLDDPLAAGTDVNNTATVTTRELTTPTKSNMTSDPVAMATIGDRVYFDANANGSFDTGEGMDGITVELKQGSTVIATTNTAYASSQPVTISFPATILTTTARTVLSSMSQATVTLLQPINL